MFLIIIISVMIFLSIFLYMIREFEDLKIERTYPYNDDCKSYKEIRNIQIFLNNENNKNQFTKNKIYTDGKFDTTLQNTICDYIHFCHNSKTHEIYVYKLLYGEKEINDKFISELQDLIVLAASISE